MPTLAQWLAYVRKALVAGAAAAAVAGTAVLPGSDGGSSITLAEWLAVATAAAGALGVYIVPNGPRPGSSGGSPDGA